jgi:signal transduction histidine kinase/ActR/RegA family two-component response regulator
MGSVSSAAPLDYRALFHALPGLYVVLRPDFTIAAASDAYLAATFTRREDILGRGIFEVFPADPDADATAVDSLRVSLNRVLATGRADAMQVQQYDIRRGGSVEPRYWSPLNAPVLGPDGKVALIVHRMEDITDFVRLEAGDRRVEEEAQRLRERAERMEAEQLERERVHEALREAQKLEAIGRLTGGIAHEFNNLLTVILGNAELLRVSPTVDDGVAMIESIERASEQGSRLTRQMLAFARRQALSPEIVDLASRSDELGAFLGRSLRGNIRLVVTIADGTWPIECDIGELDLALINLCVNARDAMPDGGLLRIDARNASLEGGEFPGVKLAGDFVLLSVTDTGTGIDPGVLARVFEPFFTTKAMGKGSGLGLSQVQGFAAQAGGAVSVKSEPGRGAKFTVCLPRAHVEPTATQLRTKAPRRGTGAILVVEDDEAVAKTAQQLLDFIGYRSQWVPDARTALAVLLGGQRFDLVFTDVMMPGGISGLELARKIRRHFPALPVLLASGYNFAAAEVAQEGLPIIAKPYRADSLADAIRKAIAQAGDGQRNTA